MNTDLSSINKYFSFLDPKEPPVIGVDISSSSVKMVELNKKGDKYVFEGYAIESIPTGAITEGNVVDSDAVSNAISKCHKKLGSNIKNFAICLPNNMVIQKKIMVGNTLSDDDIAETVESEANQYIPFPIDEVNIDWQILGPSKIDPENENEILITVAKKENIIDRVACLDSIGFKASIITTELFSLMGAVDYMTQFLEHKDLPLVLIEGGHNFTSLTIFQEGTNVFNKDIPMGSYYLTESIQNYYSLSPTEAEEVKKTNGEGVQGYKQNVLDPFMQTFASEINRALHFYLAQSNVDKIGYIILSGGLATLNGIDEAIADTTDIDTLKANPFISMSMNNKLKSTMNDINIPLLLTAFGLALRRFD